jgi:hypothetical protein
VNRGLRPEFYIEVVTYSIHYSYKTGLVEEILFLEITDNFQHFNQAISISDGKLFALQP